MRGMGRIFGSWVRYVSMSLAIIIAFVGAAIALIPVDRAVAQEGPYLRLVEKVIPEPYSHWRSIADGHITNRSDDGVTYFGDFTWTPVPETIDARGFDITVTAAIGGTGGITSGTSISTDDFEWNTAERGVYFTAPAGQTITQSLTIRVTPRASMADGEIVELWVGGAYGPGVTYKYKVSNKPEVVEGHDDPKDPDNPDDPGDAKEALAATLECDSSVIVISALPSLNCHIIITSWRRNTADPVEVVLPLALDTFGNHAVGLQVDGDGVQDVFNKDLPYSWGLFVFACASQVNTGSNCYGSETAPGPVSVPIEVRQKGSPPVLLSLNLEAVMRDQGERDGRVVRFGNVWRVGTFINLEENGSVANRAIFADWQSAQWAMEPVKGTGFVRLRNVWRPDIYLHTERDRLEAGKISPSWLSAHWTIEQVQGTTFFRLANRRATGQYLHTENGGIELGHIQPDWLSAQWWQLP